jgi:hypothetical protein
VRWLERSMLEGEADELKVYMDILNFTHSDYDFVFGYVVRLFVLLRNEALALLILCVMTYKYVTLIEVPWKWLLLS